MGTMDTKGREVGFLRDRLEALGLKALCVDVGFLKPSSIHTDIDRATVARAAGYEPEMLTDMKRELAVEVMGRGAGALLSAMKDLGGAIALGGNQGTAIAGIAMRMLPIGFPKLILSTVASGDIRPFIQYKDIHMAFSAVDVEFGPNPVLDAVLTNAAAAMAGMIRYGCKSVSKPSQKTIAVTTLGSTGAATAECVKLLREQAYVPTVFHTSGAGGSAMEELIEQGFLDGVLDLNLHEIVGEVFPEDIYKPMKPRLESSRKRAIPVVAAPGSMNYFVFGPLDSVPEKFRDGRKIHQHNPYNTNIRLTVDELMQVADRLASKLNALAGHAVLLIPTKGWSSLDTEGAELYEPGSNEAFIGRLRSHLKSQLAVEELNMHINDAAFARYAVEVLQRISMNQLLPDV
ncbi:MAG TPA: Tm-1-like ATP-binding domain-containing protein [Candidatus Bathyarchaeia archaeon]|nr:Tm-1-like ATP-binding domain-containing protein [Candidatus Bathyarchaeia archaeon]